MSSFKGSTFVCEARIMHNVLIEDCRGVLIEGFHYNYVCAIIQTIRALTIYNNYMYMYVTVCAT